MKNQCLKEFVKYSSCNVIGMIGLSCYILGDTFFVAKALGTDGLTALNFCIPVYSIMVAVGLMIGIGGAARYTIFRASGEKEKSDTVFMHSLVLGGAAAVIFTVIGLLFAKPIVSLLGAEGHVLTLSEIYVKTLLCFSAAFLLNNILLAFVRNDGNPALSMTAMLVSSFSNIILDYIFLFPMKMGMFGAVFATGLSPVISIIILSLHFFRHKNGFSLCKFKPELKRFGGILSLGLSSFVTEMSSAISVLVFNLVILGISGSIGVAAYGVVANVALVAISISNGVAQGMQPLASKYYGGGESNKLKKVYYYGAVSVLSAAALVYIFSFLFTNNLVKVFNSENDLVLQTLAEKGVRLYFSGFFFAGINIITAAFISATANARDAFIISILRSCVLLIPMVFVMSKLFEMNGVWLSFVVTEFIVMAVSIFMFRKNINNRVNERS